MTKSGKKVISMLTARLTEIVSVALVLMFLNLLIITVVATKRIGDGVVANAGFVAIVAEGTDSIGIDSTMQKLRLAEYAADVKFSTADEVLERWQTWTADSQQMGFNPFLPEYEVKVHPRWASKDSLEAISEQLMADCEAVADVKMHGEMVDRVNSALDSLATALAIIAVLLLIVSIALINNTVRLTIHSHRFSIYTMKLVGATPAFIRRPYILEGVANGAIAGLVAAIIFGLIATYISYAHPILCTVLTLSDVIYTAIVSIIVGVILCCVASALAANRYINIGYERMYR